MRYARSPAVRRLALTAVLVPFSAACATAGKYETQLRSWMGADVNQLMASWGPPSNQYIMPDGDTMYTWLWVGGTRITTNYNEYLGQATTGSVTYWCKTTFTADQSGRLVHWQWSGNACRSQ